eukprot:gb/GECG01011350.1/.p1 GENE.gb/GECG01011350.1/~~gb/GECG01011350.1/.p1  ORF type:complete len:110 (+),score=13.08 gb/GECG01011350.1/:1-330(+)
MNEKKDKVVRGEHNNDKNYLYGCIAAHYDLIQSQKMMMFDLPSLQTAVCLCPEEHNDDIGAVEEHIGDHKQHTLSAFEPESIAIRIIILWGFLRFEDGVGNSKVRHSKY